LKRCVPGFACLLLACSLAFGAQERQGKSLFVWPGFEQGEAKALPHLPDPLGVAGPFVGVSNDALIVAGGAHFRVSPFKGGTKLWLNTIYVLEKAEDGRYRWHTDQQKLIQSYL
jgi:hypothetical protein